MLKLCRYRRGGGDLFDRIVWIEMMEAVGREFLGTFLKLAINFLAEDGIAVIQVITMPDPCYAQYNL